MENNNKTIVTIENAYDFTNKATTSEVANALYDYDVVEQVSIHSNRKGMKTGFGAGVVIGLAASYIGFFVVACIAEHKRKKSEQSKIGN